MRHHPKFPGGSPRRATWLATAAVLALSVSGAALAQQGQQQGQQQNQSSQAPSGGTQTQSGNPLGPQLQATERSLRQSQQQLAQQGQNAGQPNWEQARRAVSAGQETLGRAPSDMQGQEAFRTARTQLSEAQSAIQGDSPDRQRAATQLREAADAVAALVVVVTTADAGTASGGRGAQITVQRQAPQVNVEQPAPQVTVQQPRPQVTVQQPAPQVTVQQPQPQVTVRQPEPQVTVRQAQPQVNVEQAQPQVNVERQGQPQVTVQRQGEPQVNVERQGQAQVNVERQGQAQTQQQRDQQQRDRETGATTATPAPAQSGGAQTAAVSPAAGVSLQQVSNLIGTNVVGADGRESGEVENLLLDRQGNVRAALVEWGGFLGIGTRRAVVPMERIDIGSRPARLGMTREELEALPTYNEANIVSYGRDRGWGEGVRMYR